MVMDQGTPSRSDSTLVLVAVLDTNDSPPSFLSSSYTASVQENSASGTDLILTPPLRATDDDQVGTPNSELTFSIASGDPQQVISINSMTGQLQTVEITLTLSKPEGLIWCWRSLTVATQLYPAPLP